MRTRLLVALSAVAVVLVCVAGALALWGDGPAPNAVVTVDVKGLEAGRPRALVVTLPGERDHDVRLVLTRQPDGGVAAFVGKSTHLGCRLLFFGDPHYGDGLLVAGARTTFQDPCGGSTFGVDGRCTGGPCPRGLDGYAVRLENGVAEIDLLEPIIGARRGATAQACQAGASCSSA